MIGDLFAAAAFASAFLKTESGTHDVRQPCHTVVALAAYAHVLLNRGVFGGLWLLDLALFSMATVFLVRAHLDAEARPRTGVLFLVAGVAIAAGGLTARGGSAPARPVQAALPSIAPATPLALASPGELPPADGRRVKALLDELAKISKDGNPRGLLEGHADQRLREVVENGHLAENLREVQNAAAEP